MVRFPCHSRSTKGQPTGRSGNARVRSLGCPKKRSAGRASSCPWGSPDSATILVSGTRIQGRDNTGWKQSMQGNGRWGRGGGASRIGGARLVKRPESSSSGVKTHPLGALFRVGDMQKIERETLAGCQLQAGHADPPRGRTGTETE